MKKTIPPSAIAKTAAGVGAVAATVALGMLVKRQRVRATCKPFYSGATRCFKIPGLNEGFVPQDLFYLDDEKPGCSAATRLTGNRRRSSK